MKKVFKRLFLGLGIMAILLLVGFAVLMFMVDANSFRPVIVNVVKDKAGITLFLNGDMKFKVFPWPAITIEDVAVLNAPGFEPEYLFTSEQVAVGVKLRPLLDKRLEITNLLINNAAFYVTVDTEGNTNLQNVITHKSVSPVQPAVYQRTQQGEPEAKVQLDLLKDSVINELAVHNLQVVYVNMQTDDVITVDSFNLDMEKVGFNAPVKTGLVFKAFTNTGYHGNVSIGGILQFDGDMIQFGSLQGTFGLSDREASFNFKSNIKADVEYSLNSGSAALVLVSADNDIAHPAMALPLNVKLAGSAALDRPGGQLVIDGVSVTGAGINGTFSGLMSGLQESPAFDGALELISGDLSEVLSRFKADYKAADASVLKNLNVSGKLHYSNGTLSAPFSILLDATKATADVKVSLESTNILVAADLGWDNLDLDRYLPAAIGNQNIPSASRNSAAFFSGTAFASTAGAGDFVLASTSGTPPKASADLPDINLSFKGSKLKVKDIPVENLEGKIFHRDNRLRLQDIKAGVAGGSVNADAQVSLKGEGLEANFKANMTAMDLPFLVYRVKEDLLESFIVPSKLNLDITGGYKGNTLDISSLKVKADVLEANGTVKLILEAKPLVNFNLSLNDINMANYLPAEKRSAALPVPVVPVSLTNISAEQETLNLNNLPVNVEGRLSVKSLVDGKLRLDNINGNLTLKNGVLNIASLTAKAYGGDIKLTSTSVQGRDRIKHDATLDITRIQFKELIERGTSFDKTFMSGYVSAAAKLEAQGLGAADLLSTLNGTLDYKMADAVIYGIGYDPDGLNVNNIKSFRLLGAEKQTKIDDIDGRITVTEGRMEIKPLKAKSKYLSLSVGGFLGLGDMSVDLTGDVVVEGITLPLIVKGRPGHIQVGIDQEKLITGLLEKYAKKAVEEVIKNVPKIDAPSIDVPSSIKDGLDSLLKSIKK